jgi:hypothetical protein
MIELATPHRTQKITQPMSVPSVRFASREAKTKQAQAERRERAGLGDG